MYPGVDPRQMKAMMKKMGMHEEHIPAIEVVIRTKDKDIVIADPQVSLVKMMGQSTYQVMGEATEHARESAPDIKEDDIETVMEQAHVDRDTALSAIKNANGDLAEAIMNLSSDD